MKVLISNGAHRFHLSAAASGLAKKHQLELFISAGYPTKAVKKFIGIFCQPNSDRIKRLFDREEDQIPNNKVYAIWSSEFLTQVAVLVGRVARDFRYTSAINSFSFKLYGLLAAVKIALSRGDVYHYRAGFGGLSVAVARLKGMACICDHSAVDPRLFEYLIRHSGSLPENGYNGTISSFWSWVDKDIRRADHVIVNSDFVKDTMGLSGWDSSRISVAYLGLDEKFVASMPTRDGFEGAVGRVIFAGRVSRSKGFDLVADALLKANGAWELVIAGGVDPDIAEEYRGFLCDPRVNFVGFVSRAELARYFSESDILFFPSLAEGSARVVFEALAAGCYVITTRNAGSIVESGVHGELITPGDIESAVTAINYALGNLRLVRNKGVNNSFLVANNYTQRAYVNELSNIYKKVCADQPRRQS